MLHKPALWIALVLTVFSLFAVATVFAATSPVASPVGSQAAPAVEGTISPDMAQLISEREVAYTQLIDQANQQLAQAQVALAAAEANAQSGQEEPVATTISPEGAVQIALGSALSGAQLQGEAQLVNYEGIVAYEVPFDIGNIYIDATSGDLLFNGTINLEPSPITAEQAAQIAAGYMGRSDVFKVETVQLYGLNVYRVKFSNSDAVFVDQYGQILLVRLAATGSGAEDSHEDRDDDHEDESDDD
ncbi:MAG: PepSY domain-containing protein [Anaerolineales bacterium]